MDVVARSERPIRLAVLTLSISHFESPLFRLCGQTEEFEFKVFYLHPVKTNQVVDTDYGQEIDWGSDLLAGFKSSQCENSQALSRSADEWRADVVMLYGYGWPGAPRLILQNWWRRMPQVHRGTLNFYRDPRRPIKGRLMRPLGRGLLKLFDAHHFGGDYSRKVLTDAGVNASAMFFVPYSVDTPHFMREADDTVVHEVARKIRNDRNWGADDHVILLICQHNWFKGPDIAMSVFQQVASSDSKARFLILGSGRMTQDMKVFARKNLDPKSVFFAGFVSSSETVPYYLASDLVVCTSRYETWARMLNEAMLCRRPCVISRIVPAAGGLVIDGQNGYVVEAPETRFFVPIILEHFRTTEADRTRMGDSARANALCFAYEPHIQNVVEAARYAIANTRSGKVGRFWR